MMQVMRKRTRLILFVVVASFALLIFFQWGLDATGMRSSQKMDIVKVDGTPMAYTDYLRFAQSKEEEQRGISRDEIWTQLIQEIILSNLLKKENLRITDEEIIAIIKSNPPREIYESPYMKNEKGEFDFQKYAEFLASPQSQQWLLQYEYNLRKELPREKLSSLLNTMGWVSPYEDSILIAEQTVKYDISFLSLPLYRMSGQAKVIEAEMRAYYDKNLQEFARPQSKILKYVFFESKPSPDDTTEAKERIEDFMARIKEDGEDFLTVAKEVSDDPKIENKFQAETELSPYIKDVYKKLTKGGISEIITTPQGYEIVKRVEKGLIYDVKTNIKVSQTTVADLNDRIVAFKDNVHGIGFEGAANEIDLQIRKTYPLHETNINFPVRNPQALVKFVKRAKKGALGGPFSSLSGYYVFAVDSIIPQAPPTFEEALPRLKAKFEREKSKETMVSHIAELSNRLKNGTTMSAIAASDSLVVLNNDLKQVPLMQIVSTYGEEFGGVVASLEPNQTSPPLITDWNGYIIHCDRKVINPFDSTMISMLQMKRQIRLQQLYQGLFTPKKIEDNRDEFLE